MGGLIGSGLLLGKYCWKAHSPVPERWFWYWLTLHAWTMLVWFHIRCSTIYTGSSSHLLLMSIHIYFCYFISPTVLLLVLSFEVFRRVLLLCNCSFCVLEFHKILGKVWYLLYLILFLFYINFWERIVVTIFILSESYIR